LDNVDNGNGLLFSPDDNGPILFRVALAVAAGRVVGIKEAPINKIHQRRPGGAKLNSPVEQEGVSQGSDV
jgi:hypothetical protein